MGVFVNDGGIEKEAKMIYVNDGGVDKPVLGGGKKGAYDYAVYAITGANYDLSSFVEIGDLLVGATGAPSGAMETPSGWTNLIEINTHTKLFSCVWDGTQQLSGSNGTGRVGTYMVFRGVSSIGERQSQRDGASSSFEVLDDIDGISPGSFCVAISSITNIAFPDSSPQQTNVPYVNLSPRALISITGIEDPSQTAILVTKSSTNRGYMFSVEIKV